MLSFKTHTLENTIKAMYQLIDTHFQDVASYLHQLPDIQSQFNFVKNVPYIEDATAPECDYCEECVKAPLRTIQYGGDCDDKVILLGSFMKLDNIPYRIVTVSYPDDPNTQVHTYLEVQINGTWKPLDATYSSGVLYTEVPFAKKIVWNR